MKLIDKVKLDHSLCYDFLTSLMRLNHNDDFAPSDQPNQEIYKIIENAQSLITPEIREKLKIFCNLETSYAVFLASYIQKWQTKNVPEFLKRIEEDVTPEEILHRFLYSGIGPGQDITLDTIKDLINNNATAIEFINKHISYSPEDKWQLLQFLTNPAKMKKDLMELYHWHYEKIYQHHEEFVENFIVKYEKELTNRLNKYGEEYFSLLVPIDFEKHNDQSQITLALSCFYEMSCMVNMMHDLYLFGYRCQEQIEGNHSVLAATQIFKALADETRLNIIKVLSERPWYGHELALKLNVSNSTVSHHVSNLVMNGLIQSYRQDNRIYFELDLDQLKETILKTIDNMVDPENQK